MNKLPVAEGLALLSFSLISLSFCSYDNTVTQFDVVPLPKDDNVFALRTELDDGLDCKYPTDCYDVMQCDRNDSGVARVFPFGIGNGFLVYCDMNSEGGGWLVFQRRQDGTTGFYKSWEKYADGFGNLHGEFWLGLEKLHLLTSQRRYELLVNLGSYDNGTRYSRHDRFYISDESHKFQLLLGTYSGDAGNSLSHHNGYKFSTSDQDNDRNPAGNCAFTHFSGWWFAYCHKANLNGKYVSAIKQSDNIPEALSWYHWTNSYKTMQFTEMKLRPYM